MSPIVAIFMTSSTFLSSNTIKRKRSIQSKYDFVLGYKEIDNVSQIKQPTNNEILNESPSEYNFRHYTEI
ncbi:hypothetical protein RO3G_02754 [Rhizopus delemar RA 99-880]|uniref:Uncharacterized protein n=1 Tax=Rhizopus delemar (strain RA 99-880 / ATCC MYA-4621 / FGSC 9543 / NRRL 43880) TaxID=246409 RepID=I1BPC0_RHIO9|nr:hypothetical protein RO3G_02754 [Rhizopus delemar RA 99-880]|eukprot:EIE78050.1 hypothetical protein RO3G_02754 [Rhizopus delemar RA 99-880]